MNLSPALVLPLAVRAAAELELRRRRAAREREAQLNIALQAPELNRFFDYYPDQGPYRRELYKKHMEFFAAGAQHNERLFMAANRIGKTMGVGGYESTCHLTGRYPHWWPGRKFDTPVDWWIAGKTNETTRDIIQKKLFGDVSWSSGRKRVSGTGLVPYQDIGDITWKSGVPDLIDTIKIRHRPTDGWSTCGIKTYQQGRGSFEGTEKHGIWLDEEPPGNEGVSIYAECLTRTMTTNGIVMITFTPLEGLSQVVLSFMPSAAPIPEEPTYG